jgi:hypothetical protein
MSLIPFRCGLGEVTPGAPSAFCLNGGLCRVEPSTGRHYCECQKGYLNDYTVGHFPNCGVPEHALGVIAGIVVALAVITYLVSVPIYLEVEHKVKSLVGQWILATTLVMAMALALWAEQGGFRGFHICLLLFDLTVYRNIKTSTLTFSGPLYALLGRDMTWFQRKLTGLEIINDIGQVATIVPLLIFSRDDDPGNFNVAMVAYLFLFAFATMATTIFMVFQTLELKRSVASLTRALNATSSSPANDKLVKFEARLRSMFLFNVSLFANSLLLIVFPLVILVLGSFPGQYILLAFLHIVVPLSGIGASIILSRQSGDQVQAAAITGPTSSKPVVSDSPRIVAVSVHAESSA